MCQTVNRGWMVCICWHASKERPREEGMWTAGTPPLPLQSWELSLSAASSPWQPTLAQSLSTNLYLHFLAYNDNSYPYVSHILFRRQALERPRLEWGTETMNTISCSKVKKKKDDCIPPLLSLRTDKAILLNACKSPIVSFSLSRCVHFLRKQTNVFLRNCPDDNRLVLFQHNAVIVTLQRLQLYL